MRDLLTFPIMVFPTAPLLRRVWELRPNVAAYDACYVGLAEVFGTLLLLAVDLWDGCERIRGTVA